MPFDMQRPTRCQPGALGPTLVDDVSTYSSPFFGKELGQSHVQDSAAAGCNQPMKLGICGIGAISLLSSSAVCWACSLMTSPELILATNSDDFSRDLLPFSSCGHNQFAVKS